MRSILILLLKLAVALGLIAYVVASGKIDSASLKRLLSAPDYFVGALVLLSIQTILVALRLKILLRAHSDALSFWTVLQLTYVGAFFDLIAITSVGGDAVKAFYLARGIPSGRRTASVSVLLVDRILGVFGMLSLTLFAVAWSAGELWSDSQFRPYLAGLLSACGALVLGMFLLFSRRVHDWAPWRILVAKLPLGHTFNRAYTSMSAFRDRPLILIEGWALAIGVHLLGCAAGYLLASGLALRGIDTPSGASMAVPPGVFFGALMISNFISSFAPFGAIGVGQAAYAFVFARIAHLNGGADLATALQVAFILVKAPGFLAWLAMRRKR